MPKQDNDILLHRKTHHTNLSVPFSDYINVTMFPEQDDNLLETIIPIKHRNMYIVDLEESEYYENPDKYDPHNIYTTNCKIVRCDKVEPYRLIAVSEDYKFIFVADYRYYQEQVVQYPIQLSEFIGINCHNQYPAIINEMKSITLRVDNGEPCYSVLVEFVSDDVIRVLLGDECFTKLEGYCDCEDIESDVFLEFKQIKNLENTLKTVYNKQRTLKEVINIRKLVFEGRTIYGSKNCSFGKS